MKIVFDTNVLFSAALNASSAPAKALMWAVNHAQLFALSSTLEELANVLSRTKHISRLSEARRMDFLEVYAANVTLVQVVEDVKECRDPKDDQFLSLALAASADVIVSGDKDLQTMNPWRGIIIESPSEFLSRANII